MGEVLAVVFAGDFDGVGFDLFALSGAVHENNGGRATGLGVAVGVGLDFGFGVEVADGEGVGAADPPMEKITAEKKQQRILRFMKKVDARDVVRAFAPRREWRRP